ncbi:recombinase family protein [Methylosinus sp. H3A]|nr:recombinase family protein [Methylosinus sp. H3A]MBG0808098.1 recombinase family protein [Methylosinus sp. H3A]
MVKTAENLKGRGTGLVSLTDVRHLVVGRDAGFRTLATIAEFERALIRERTAAGLAEAKHKGKMGGRPSRLTEKDVTAAKV